MDKTIFFAPDILKNNELPEDEAKHCVRVLRMTEGDEILITDGKGYFYEAQIASATSKHCYVNIQNTISAPNFWNFNIHIAFAPTKNMDRTEWFVEKATEIGINRFTPLLCKHSERKVIKNERIEKILVSAIKQSQKATLPKLDDMISFSKFVIQPFEGRKFIAHCYEQKKLLLKDVYKKGESVLILIGPEGDFSEQEVDLAIKNNFEPISLGESRLRTETAALVSCNTVHILNQ